MASEVRSLIWVGNSFFYYNNSMHTHFINFVKAADAEARPRGHAIQLRINMETMTADGSAKPGGGTLAVFEPPSGPGVRVDTYGYAGYRTNYGKIHYVQTLAREHPLIMRPGHVYRLAVNFEPDVTHL